MNIQARTVRRPERNKNSAGSSLKRRMLFIFNLVLLCSAVFVIANAKIALTQEIADIEHNIAIVRNQINQLDRESEDLELRIERLTGWNNIRAKIIQFNLPLRPATAEQNAVLRNFRNSQLTPASATASVPVPQNGI